jgi:hypothetical protein
MMNASFGSQESTTVIPDKTLLIFLLQYYLLHFYGTHLHSSYVPAMSRSQARVKKNS